MISSNTNIQVWTWICIIKQHEQNIYITNLIQIYSIGFSLYPENNYPSGLANVSKNTIKFTFDVKSGVIFQNYKITIIFFGYKVFEDNL